MKKGQTDSCVECLEEQIRNNVPVIQRKIIPAHKCKKHGNPANISNKWAFYITLFSVVMPYSVFISIKHKDSDKIKEIPVLNLDILKTICDILNISLKQAWIEMNFIYQIWNE